jgi:hypothetical protein
MHGLSHWKEIPYLKWIEQLRSMEPDSSGSAESKIPDTTASACQQIVARFIVRAYKSIT